MSWTPGGNKTQTLIYELAAVVRHGGDAAPRSARAGYGKRSGSRRTACSAAIKHAAVRRAGHAGQRASAGAERLGYSAGSVDGRWSGLAEASRPSRRRRGCRRTAWPDGRRDSAGVRRGGWHNVRRTAPEATRDACAGGHSPRRLPLRRTRLLLHPDPTLRMVRRARCFYRSVRPAMSELKYYTVSEASMTAAPWPPVKAFQQLERLTADVWPGPKTTRCCSRQRDFRLWQRFVHAVRGQRDGHASPDSGSYTNLSVGSSGMRDRASAARKDLSTPWM